MFVYVVLLLLVSQQIGSKITLEDHMIPHMISASVYVRCTTDEGIEKRLTTAWPVTTNTPYGSDELTPNSTVRCREPRALMARELRGTPPTIIEWMILVYVVGRNLDFCV